MRNAAVWSWARAVLAAAALGSFGAAACAGSGAERRSAPVARHPEVDAGLDTCATCHAQATPAVVQQWSDGRHGLALVQCVVCHGSTEADFQRRPTTAACQGCHAKVAAPASQTCFGCHPPHALRAQGASPHGA
jgi:hypothetical protein